jgi:putative polysaccharide biosynthesis protein
MFGKLRKIGNQGFPFMLRRPKTPIARLRRLGSRNAYARHGVFARNALRIGMGLGWPLGAFVESVRNVRRIAVERPEAALLPIFFDMYRLALLYNIPPRGLRGFGLYRPEHRGDLHQYLFTGDVPALLALNRRRGADHRDVNNKLAFAKICEEHALPHVATLAAFSREKQLAPVGPFVPDSDTLFIKDLYGSGGRGVEEWTRKDGHFFDSAGQCANAEELVEILRSRDCIVQPVIRNHPAFAVLTDGPLATLRLITMINGAGEAELVGALAYFPRFRGDRRGRVYSVDVQRGILAAGIDLFERKELLANPDSGRIGIEPVIPFWRQSVELAARAHRIAFPRFATLGWDVALAANGPLLLETNSGWSFTHLQRLNGPLGRSRFGSILAEILPETQS